MPTFTDIGAKAAEGCLVKPLFHQFFQDPNIKFEFSLRVARPVPRPYDGWFHASVHPLATDRALWMYLAHPEKVVREAMDYTSLMSVMFGSLGHAVIEAFLERLGVAVPLPPGLCPVCGLPRKQVLAGAPASKYCTEHGFADPETRARCHLDSILDFKGRGVFGFDFKSIHQFGLRKVPDMDAAAFRETWPGYWAQMQECMRLSGLRRYIVFFLTLGNPWDTREFHFDYDPAFAAQTELKYKRVISCVERGQEILL
jgi:hypothetical protein